jgi:hypothetical protein
MIEGTVCRSQSMFGNKGAGYTNPFLVVTPCPIMLVSNLLQHYRSNEYSIRTELQHSAPGLCAAFRRVIGSLTESSASSEQLAHEGYFLLTSLADHEGLVAHCSSAYGLYRFGFDDEASRQDYLDQRIRERLRQTVFKLMAELRESRKIAYSWQCAEGVTELSIHLGAGGATRQHIFRYSVPEKQSALSEDLPALGEFVDTVCKAFQTVVREPANWPVPGEDERLKVRELVDTLFAGLSTEQLQMLGRHPECVSEAFGNVLKRLGA